MATYDLGQGVNLRYLATDRDGEPTDATVALVITKPNGTTTGPLVVRTALGVYDAATYVPDAVGEYTYRWVVTGAITDSALGSFTVSDPGPQEYAQLELVKAQLGKITRDDRDEMIQASILAASRMIDSETGVWPGAYRADRVATSRTFTLQGRRYLTRGNRVAIIVDPISSASGVTVETGYAATGLYVPFTSFTTGPENAIVRGRPIIEVYGAPGSFLSDSIRITARWGWPTIPAEIELATRLQAARLYRRKDSPQGVIASPEFGGLRVSRFDPDVRALLAPFMTPGFA